MVFLLRHSRIFNINHIHVSDCTLNTMLVYNENRVRFLGVLLTSSFFFRPNIQSICKSYGSTFKMDPEIHGICPGSLSNSVTCGIVQ